MHFRPYRFASILCLLSTVVACAQQTPSTPIRARDLGVAFEGTPGALNAITDVPGVEVGATTLIRGEGALKVGEGPVRTGVTVILPRGKTSKDPATLWRRCLTKSFNKC